MPYSKKFVIQLFYNAVSTADIMQHQMRYDKVNENDILGRNVGESGHGLF
jgi:hypothetical protein